MTPIIQSLLETDLYKFTMWQTMLHKNPSTVAEYRFVCRNEAKLSKSFSTAELLAQINEQLDALCTLTFKEDELQYLRKLPFMKPDFIEFLGLFRLQRKFITAEMVNGKIEIVAKGPQVHVMFFEIFVLAIVNELYFMQFDDAAAKTAGLMKLSNKIAYLRGMSDELTVNKTNPFVFFDFGIRRRFSREWQDLVIRTLKSEVPEFFKGTSNVYLAKKYDLTPIGTMAHEYLQTYQGLGTIQLRQFQKAALEDWVQEYRGDLGIALTDVVGMDAFLSDFDLYFAKLFDGLRHDSGCPFEWGEKAIAHYQKLRIDPKTKRLVFSDGLDLKTAIAIYKRFEDRSMTGFGIGTNLTNDMALDMTPLNIVMKIVKCNGQPVAKLSDTPGKTLCDDETFLSYLRQVFKA